MTWVADFFRSLKPAGWVVVAAVIGTALGSIVTGELTGWTSADRRGTIEADSSKMERPDEGDVPDHTTVHAAGSTAVECLPVPMSVINERIRQLPGSTQNSDDQAPPDTVVEYRTRFTDVPGPTAPSVSWSSRAGLASYASSRFPFLYLPLTEDGRPAIQHNGDRTIVPAYGQDGKGYEFAYRYRPDPYELFAEVYGRGAWWPPTTPLPRSTAGAIGADVGLRVREVRIQAGGAYSTQLGPAVRSKVTWRPVSWSFSLW